MPDHTPAKRPKTSCLPWLLGGALLFSAVYSMRSNPALSQEDQENFATVVREAEKKLAEFRHERGIKKDLIITFVAHDSGNGMDIWSTHAFTRPGKGENIQVYLYGPDAPGYPHAHALIKDMTLGYLGSRGPKALGEKITSATWASNGIRTAEPSGELNPAGVIKIFTSEFKQSGVNQITSTAENALRLLPYEVSLHVNPRPAIFQP